MKFAIGSISALFVAVAMYNLQLKLQPKLLPIVEGFFQPEFMAVANVLSHNMESGRERGAALAVYHDGEPVIDMWAGYADPNSLTRWRNHTTTLTFDCSKAVMAILVAIMVEKEMLNYSVPISVYWPEFGLNGGHGITVEQLLSHQAGLPYLSESISWRDIHENPDNVNKLLQRQSPLWTPGSQFGYHSSTYGLILDRLVQKLDPAHRDVGTLFEDDIARKYDIEFSFRVKKQDYYKTARVNPVSMTTRLIQLITSPTYLRHLLSTMFLNTDLSRTLVVVKELAQPYSVLNNPELREIPISSFTGTGTARGLAKLFSLLFVDKTSSGKPLLYPSTLKMLKEKLTEGTCCITGLPMRFGRGVQIFTNPFGEPVFGHAGEGGQMVLADPQNKLTIVYLTNHLSVYRNGEDQRITEILSKVYHNLERYIDRKKSQGG